MKSNLSAKLIIAIFLCLIMALTFTACRDKEIYAESSDFESYPDYWNDFNEDHGDLYVPDSDDTSTNETIDWGDTDGDDSNDDIDTDKDGISNKQDYDIDGDGVKNEDDSDIDGDGVGNENDPDIDGDDIPNENDPDKDGVEESNKNEGPFVPLN